MFCIKNCLTGVFFCCMWLDVVIHVKMFSDGFEGFWELLTVLFGTMAKNVYWARKRVQVPPKMSLINWYCCIWSSANQRKRRADWSILWMAICINMPSMSARTATGCSRNLIRTPKSLLSRSGPARRLDLRDWPRKFEAAFATPQTFPGL